MKYILVLLFAFCLVAAPNILTAGDDDDVYKIKTVVIDAGHGGKDPGAIGYSKVKEKDVALAVSLKVGQYIEENLPDVKVIYTRKTDVFLELHERSKIANDANADLFISIHANSTNSTQAWGTETWVLGLHRTDDNLEVLERENSVIEMEENAEDNYDDVNSPQFQIKLAQMQSAYLTKSIELADSIEKQFKHRVKRKSRGVKQAGFYVLVNTGMPGVLVELGFLSNPTEEKYLASEDGQTYLASAIYRAVRDYKQSIDEEAALVAAQQKEFEAKEEEKKGISFKVQVMASKKPAKEKSAVYKDFAVLSEIENGGTYRYYAYDEKNYADMMLKLAEAKEKGYKDAFPVAFKDGKKISVKEARTLLQQ